MNRGKPMKRLVVESVFAILLAGTLLITGCATVQRREGVPPDERWVYTVRELPGRGERLRGELRFRNYRLPDYFSEVVIGERRFTMALRAATGPYEGYREDTAFTLDRAIGELIAQQPPEDEPSSLSTSERTRGWYLGGLHERRVDTPDEWIWVRRENLEAWVNPRRIEAFASSFQIAGMNEHPQPRFQFMFSYGVRR